MKIALAGPVNLRMVSDILGVDCFPENGPPVVADLARAYYDRGHDVNIITFGDTGGRLVREFSAPRFGVTVCSHRRGYAAAATFFSQEVAEITKAIERLKPDVVHVNWTYEFARAAIRSGRPYIVTARDIPAMLFGFMRPRYYWWPRLLQGYLVSRQARTMTGQSPYTVAMWRKYMARAGHMVMIPNSVPDWIRSLERPTNLPPEPLMFASIANGFDRRKNIHGLLRAFALVRSESPSAVLHLFGCGYEKGGPAENWAARRSLSGSVAFRGVQPYRSMLQELAATASVYVHPSLEESFGMTVAEAMAMGLPVVGGEDSGAVPWLLDGGRAGILCDVGCPYSLAKAMLDATNKPDLGLAARNRVATHFSADATVESYLRLLQQECHHALAPDRKPTRTSDNRTRKP